MAQDERKKKKMVMVMKMVMKMVTVMKIGNRQRRTVRNGKENEKKNKGESAVMDCTVLQQPWRFHFVAQSDPCFYFSPSMLVSMKMECAAWYQCDHMERVYRMPSGYWREKKRWR